MVITGCPTTGPPRGTKVREILETYKKVDGWVQEKAENHISEMVIGGLEPIEAL